MMTVHNSSELKEEKMESSIVDDSERTIRQQQRRFSIERIASIQLPSVSDMSGIKRFSQSKKLATEANGGASKQRHFDRRLSMDSVFPSFLRTGSSYDEYFFDGVGITFPLLEHDHDPFQAKDNQKIAVTLNGKSTTRRHSLDLSQLSFADVITGGHPGMLRNTGFLDLEPCATNNPQDSQKINNNDSFKLEKESANVEYDSLSQNKTSSSITDDSSLEDEIDITKDSFANVPHESLEYPPLYFFIKRFPAFIGCVQKFYRIRWTITYPLQRRIPFSKKLRKLGLVLTWGELFLVLPLLAILLSGLLTSFWRPSVSFSGHVSRLPLALAFLTANHNSILTLFMGIPFERALKYHKLAGRIAFINGVFHTYVAFVHPTDLSNTKGIATNSAVEDATEVFASEPPAHSYIGKDPNFATFTVDGQINTSGSLILLLIFSMLVTSLPRVRRLIFELFFYIHVIFAILMVACAFYHSGIFVVVLAIALWGGDLFTRKVIMACCRYPQTATIQNLTDTVVEISFPKTKGFDYNPGQYVYLAVPELSLFQWHPFSISSSPHQETVTIHVRKRGNWTTALHNLADKKEKVKILMEGPYGALSVDIFSQRYKIMMLLSGGIGVTPMQSICHQLMHEHDTKSRTLKKLWFVWTARDPEVMENMDVTQRGSRRFNSIETTKSMRALETEKNIRDNMVRQPTTSRLAMRILTQLPNSDTPDEELERELPLDEYESDDEDEFNDECFGRSSQFNKVNLTNETHNEGMVSKDIISDDGLDDIEKGTPTSSTISTKRNVSFNMSEERLVSKNDCPSKKARPTMMAPEDNIVKVPTSSDEESAEEVESVLKLDFFLTSKEMPSQEGAMTPFITKGRPDLKGIFLQMREEAIRSGERRIAICVCAPTRLVTICRKACAKFSDDQVRFDFHSEVFD